jgi:plasmid stability protein
MSVALQIREVPEEVRSALAAQAAQQGKSMQAYLLGVLTREARYSGNVDLINSTSPMRIEFPASPSPEQIVREGREDGFGRDREELV